MSYPTCPLWKGFVERLERYAQLQEGQGDPIQRSFEVVRRLRRPNHSGLPGAIRQVLCTAPQQPPHKLRLLAQIYWPLVLTTNYDDLFLFSVHEAIKERKVPEPFTVLGRSPGHCQRVLSSLHEPAEPIFWALHGFVGGQAPAVPGDSPHLPSRELVVGHDEYRQVTHSEPHFRRAFAEVFRSRSLLFLGTSMSDQHLLGLFEEVLALGGPNPLPHFAVVSKNDKDLNRRFLRTRLNTVLIELPEYDDIEAFLQQLGGETQKPRRRAANWSYSMLSSEVRQPSDAADLELVRGRIILPQEGECIALSAGLEEKQHYQFSPAANAVLDQARTQGIIGSGAKPEPLPHGSLVTRYAGAPIFVGVPRDTSVAYDKRDLRRVFTTTLQLLDAAAGAGFRTLRTQLLGTGKSRHYPSRFALAQMLRAYAAWFRAQPARPTLRVIVHVYARDVIFDLSAGRLNLSELLTCEDIRFWAEVSTAEESLPDRQMLFMPGNTAIAEVARLFDLEGPDWRLAVRPAPTRDEREHSLPDAWAWTLDDLGVAPGSTLRFIPAPPR